jgi:hypothetical protein
VTCSTSLALDYVTECGIIYILAAIMLFAKNAVDKPLLCMNTRNLRVHIPALNKLIFAKQLV